MTRTAVKINKRTVEKLVFNKDNVNMALLRWRIARQIDGLLSAKQFRSTTRNRPHSAVVTTIRGPKGLQRARNHETHRTENSRPQAVHGKGHACAAGKTSYTSTVGINQFNYGARAKNRTKGTDREHIWWKIGNHKGQRYVNIPDI